MGKPVKGLVDALGVGAKKIGRGASRVASKPTRLHIAANSKTPIRSTASEIFMKKDKQGARIGNLYTGKQVRWTPIVGVGAVAGVAAYGTDLGGTSGIEGNGFGAQTGLMDIKHSLKTKQGTLESGQSPSLLADGSSKGSNSLGASGDIVLGLHNKRKG